MKRFISASMFRSLYFSPFRFGRDRNRVTIFGRSATVQSVAVLLLSPLASGLSQNVILQSEVAVSLSAYLEPDEDELRAGY